jgi:hypothetical protein
MKRQQYGRDSRVWRTVKGLIKTSEEIIVMQNGSHFMPKIETLWQKHNIGMILNQFKSNRMLSNNGCVTTMEEIENNEVAFKPKLLDLNKQLIDSENTFFVTDCQ